MKVYNPLVLDIKKDEPSYETDKAKWWLIFVSKDKRFLIYRVLQKESKDETYFMVDNKYNSVCENKSIEILHCRIDMLEASERLK